MRRILACLSLLALVVLPARADDGDILSRETISTDNGATVERITYESDGLKIRGYLAYPTDATERSESSGDALPCLVYNRGGNRDFGAVTDERAIAMGTGIAGWGYVLFASNYRGSTGSEGTDEFGGDDVHDIVNGIKVLDQLDFADGSRIGMWGHSRGGLMTLLALMQTDRVAAAVVSGAASDMRAGVEARPEMETNVLAEMVPDWEANREAELEKRSPVRRVDELPRDVPIFVAHGTADWRVNPRESIALAAALLDAKIPFRLGLYEGADHGISEHRDEFRADVRAWLDRFVRDGEPLPDLEPHGD